MPTTAGKVGVQTKGSRSRPGHGVVVHYHEIGLKGRNRGFFEKRLVRNLEQAIDGSEDASIDVLFGRLIVRTQTPATDELVRRVAATFGVASCSPCLITDVEIDAMIEAALGLLDARSFETFAIAARRATKELPINSRQINVELGAAVQAATGAGVDLSSPDVTVHVEVVGPRAFVYADKHRGPGGLPVGVSGKVVVLLSGGIDSPVATHRMLKRGAKAVCVHFHSAPFTDGSSARKAGEIAQVIADRQGNVVLYLVPLGDAQQRVVTVAPPELRVVLYRRLMMRIANVIARQEGAKAVVTGDSLGQVASQTLENIACADDVSTMPVLRPLIGEDKQDIIEEAKALGTYETSILPFEDCCSLFVPRSPATRARVEECRATESDLDVDALVASCIATSEIERFTIDRARVTA